MNTLLNRLVLYVNTCIKKDVNYEIAIYIIEHYSKCQNITIKKICDECYVSRASVVRFCEYFGFHSWTDLQQFLVRTKKIKEKQEMQRFKKLDVETLYQHVCHIANSFEEEFIKNIKMHVRQIVEDIHQSQKVYIFGAIYPLSLAFDFQINMITFGKIVYSDYQSKSDELEPLTKDDIAIILTASGRYIGDYKTKFKLLCNTTVKKTLISCSDQYHSLQYIDHYFTVATVPHGRFKDFDYYTMLILDIIYIEYRLKYGQEKA